MKTMTAWRMEIMQINLIWIIALIIAPSHSQDRPSIKNLYCVNDFHEKMVCSWEVVDGGANCSSDFQLKYTDFQDTTLDCQDLDNEYYGNFRVPNKCICNIKVIGFAVQEYYDIEVESQGRSVGKATTYVFYSIKPKAPSDLRLNFTKPEYGEARWKTNYNTEFIASKLSFQIQFISQEDNKTVLDDVITQLEPQYSFNSRQLVRGHHYKVRVRSKVTKDNQFWSEWSPEVVFKNDYDLTIMDWKTTIISVVCIIIVVLIIFCYFCITRTKKRWWNNIPNPARSNLAERGLIQRNYSIPTGKPSARKSCVNFLRNLVKSHMSTGEQLTKEYVAKDYLNLMENNMKPMFFEPEKVDIEKYIQLYDREDTLCQEDLPEEKEEDIHLMATDMSIGRMFCDILCDSPVNVIASEQLHVDNTFGSFGSSILRDTSQKTKRHLPLSLISQESGYQSYDSEDSPSDLKSDGPNFLYLASLSQGDFFPYAPASILNESGSRIGKEDAFVNSGYNSFASALGKAACDFKEDNRSVISLDMFCKPNYHSSLQNPKSILYYNTRYFPTCYEDDLQPTITLSSDHRIESHPTSVSEEPGYQSFNQAVQQGDLSGSTTSLVFDSGYKPFESLTGISTSSLDSGLSELEDLVQNNEDLQQAGVVNGGTDLWNDTQSSGFPLTELTFFDRKYPFFSETLEDEHKGLVNQASDIHYGINKTLKNTDKPLVLTFDISDHLKNMANMQGPKIIPGLEFPAYRISFPCSLNEASIIHDDLLDKNCLYTQKSFPVKFENMCYFTPLSHLSAEGYRHLLVQQNSTDEDGNSYMKIALW